VRPETPPGRRDATRERSLREVGLAPPLGPAGGIRGLLITNSELAVLGDGARAPHGHSVQCIRRSCSSPSSAHSSSHSARAHPHFSFFRHPHPSSRATRARDGRRCDRRRRRFDAPRHASARRARWGSHLPSDLPGAFAVSSSRTASSRCSATVLGRHSTTPCSAFDARAPVPRLGTRAHTAPGRIPTSPSFGIRILRLAQRARDGRRCDRRRRRFDAPRHASARRARCIATSSLFGRRIPRLAAWMSCGRDRGVTPRPV
jgi:hypothetical protein